MAVDEFDPNGLLPASLGTENVEWMVAMEPVEVDTADIKRFTTLYASNARSIRPSNRRFILGLS